jgi:DUF4097 and DUF4098 domain-containing protein YvlB
LNRGSGLCLESLPSSSPSPNSTKITQNTEKDYPVRSMSALMIQNAKGNIELHGWANDKIRVQLKKTVTANTQEEAQKIIELVHYRYTATDKAIEISNEYGSASELKDRLLDLKSPKAQLDLVVFAPMHMKVQLWTTGLGNIYAKNWANETVVRTEGGKIVVEEIRASRLEVSCVGCEIELKKIKAKIHATGGERKISAESCVGDGFFKSTSGPIQLENIEGDQLVVTEAGAITGKTLRGQFEFKGRQSEISLLHLEGGCSGRLESGNIRVDVAEWKPDDQNFIETLAGNLSLQLPRDFIGELDIRQNKGSIDSHFPLELAEMPGVQTKDTKHWLSHIGHSSYQLRIGVGEGDIQIIKK